MSRRLAQTSRPGLWQLTDRLDMAALARGGFRGFLVLVAGSASAPLLTSRLSVEPVVWLTAVAVAGFVVAAVHQGSGWSPIPQGIAAALCAYALTLPFLLLGPAGPDLGSVVVTALIGAVTGALVGAAVIARRRVGPAPGRAALTARRTK